VWKRPGSSVRSRDEHGLGFLKSPGYKSGITLVRAGGSSGAEFTLLGHLRRKSGIRSLIMNREGTQRLTEWSPSRFFSSDRPRHPFALILLNQPLNWTAFEKTFGSGRLLSQNSPCPDKIVLTLHTQRHLQSALMGVLTGSIWSPV
jgi:hypothetical protein